MNETNKFLTKKQRPAWSIIGQEISKAIKDQNNSPQDIANTNNLLIIKNRLLKEDMKQFKS